MNGVSNGLLGFIVTPGTTESCGGNTVYARNAAIIVSNAIHAFQTRATTFTDFKSSCATPTEPFLQLFLTESTVDKRGLLSLTVS